MGKKKNKKNKSNDVEMIENDSEMYGQHDGYVDESPIPYPHKFDREVLVTMDDDDLHRMVRSLDDSITKVSRMNLNPYPWEIEMCYVQQEMQLRSARRSAHAEWLSKLPPVEAD